MLGSIVGYPMTGEPRNEAYCKRVGMLDQEPARDHRLYGLGQRAWRDKVALDTDLSCYIAVWRILC